MTCPTKTQQGRCVSVSAKIVVRSIVEVSARPFHHLHTISIVIRSAIVSGVIREAEDEEDGEKRNVD